VEYLIRPNSYFSENSTVFDSNNKPVFLIKVRSFSFKTGVSVFNLFKEELSRTEKKFIFPLFPEYQIFSRKIKIGKLKKIPFNPISFDYKLTLNNQEYSVQFIQKERSYKIFKNDKELASFIIKKTQETMPFIEYLKNIFKNEYFVTIRENEDHAIIIAILMTIFLRNNVSYGPSTI